METCVIVGIGPGLGTALAKRFSRGGFAVALIGRSQTPVDAALAAVKDIGGNARGYRCDAADASELEAVLAKISSEMLPPSVGIYNASVYRAGTPTETSPEDLVREFRGNVVGAHVMARSLAPSMKAARRGTLLFTGSGIGVHPSAAATTLSVGKAALRALALTYAEEMEPLGVHAATVTIYGTIEAGSRFDPASIAERFWTVHAQPAGAWTREEAFR